MRINTNVMALNAQNKLTANQSTVEKSIQKLSSGLRINSAADDAAGLAISEKMRAQIRGLGQAQSNAQDGISLLQTAEGALQQTTDILQRMRELVIKAQNTGVLTDDDRTSITTEMSTLRDEIDRIATSTTFNSKKLLDGSLGNSLLVDEDGKLVTGEDGTSIASFARIDVSNALSSMTYTVSRGSGDDSKKLVMNWKIMENGVETTKTAYGDVTFDTNKIKGKVNFADAGVVIDYGAKEIATDAEALGTVTTAKDNKRADFKIGANVYEEDILAVGVSDMSSKGLNRTDNGEKFSIGISTAKEANETLDALDHAINTVTSQRATIGTIQNRMEYAVSNLSTTEENLTAAESRIRDVDMAEEMVTYTKNTILNQSAMAMLAQANQQPQAILSLLQ